LNTQYSFVSVFNGKSLMQLLTQMQQQTHNN